MSLCVVCKRSKSAIDHYRLSADSNRISNLCISCFNKKAKPIVKHYNSIKKTKNQLYGKNYRIVNKDNLKIISAKFNKRYRDNLQESYVVELLARKLKCTRLEVRKTSDLIKTYRTYIELKRKINSYGEK